MGGTETRTSPTQYTVYLDVDNPVDQQLIQILRGPVNRSRLIRTALLNYFGISDPDDEGQAFLSQLAPSHHLTTIVDPADLAQVLTSIFQEAWLPDIRAVIETVLASFLNGQRLVTDQVRIEDQNTETSSIDFLSGLMIE